MEFFQSWVIPATAAFFAAVISGSAGFGGALLLLPVLMFVFGLERALPLLAGVQLVGNAARAIFGWKVICWRSVVFFSPGAITAAVAAALFLSVIPVRQAQLFIAILVCGAAALEALTVFGKLPGALLRLKPPERPGPWLIPAGILVGTASGIAGTTGPLPNAFFLRLGLNPVAYIASEAAAMCLTHAGKVIAFGFANWLQPADYPLLALLSLAMVAGTWCGKQLALRISAAHYRKFVALWMLAAALLMFAAPAD